MVNFLKYTILYSLQKPVHYMQLPVTIVYGHLTVVGRPMFLVGWLVSWSQEVTINGQ